MRYKGGQIMSDKCKWELKRINDWYVCDTIYTYKSECENFLDVISEVIEIDNFNNCPFCAKEIEEIKDER